MSVEFSNERCPKCGSTLLVNSGGIYWCSYVGGRDSKACDYGCISGENKKMEDVQVDRAAKQVVVTPASVEGEATPTLGPTDEVPRTMRAWGKCGYDALIIESAALERELLAATAALQAAREALENFGQHRPLHCGRIETGVCDCGLSAALAKIDAAMEAKGE